MGNCYQKTKKSMPPDRRLSIQGRRGKQSGQPVNQQEARDAHSSIDNDGKSNICQYILQSQIQGLFILG